MEMKNKRVYIILAVVVLVAALVLIGNKRLFVGNTKAVISQASANKIAVEVQKTKSVELKSKMSYKATIEPVAFGIASSKISGRVSRILVENGKSVSKGDPLVLLDDQDIQNQLRAAKNQLVVSQANLKKVQTNLETTQLNYNRTKALLDQGAVSQASFDSADAALKIAKSDLDSTEASIESVKINIDTVNDQLESTIVRAPIDGIVDEKNVYEGQYISVQGGSPILAKVKDISSVNAVIQVEQSDLSHIKLGQKASVILDGNLAEPFEGVVKIMDIAANPTSRAFNCKIEVLNKAQTLRPGVVAKVEISDNQVSKAILIPIEALMGTEGNYSVYVAENTTAHKRVVTIGELVGKTVVVKSGISENETIICTNINMLQDGDTIEAALVQGD